jgi:hypothetical protein
MLAAQHDPHGGAERIVALGVERSHAATSPARQRSTRRRSARRSDSEPSSASRSRRRCRDWSSSPPSPGELFRVPASALFVNFTLWLRTRMDAARNQTLDAKPICVAGPSERPVILITKRLSGQRAEDFNCYKSVRASPHSVILPRGKSRETILTPVTVLSHCRNCTRPGGRTIRVTFDTYDTKRVT